MPYVISRPISTKPGRDSLIVYHGRLVRRLKRSVVFPVGELVDEV